MCHLICDESVVDVYEALRQSCGTTTCFCVDPAEKEPAPIKTQSRKEMTTNRTGASLLKWSLTGSDRSLVFVTETVSAWEAWWDSGSGEGFCLNEIKSGPIWRLRFCCVLGWASLLILGNSVWSKSNSTPECAMWDAPFRSNNHIYFKYDPWKLFSKIHQLKLFFGLQKSYFLCFMHLNSLESFNEQEVKNRAVAAHSIGNWAEKWGVLGLSYGRCSGNKERCQNTFRTLLRYP